MNHDKLIKAAKDAIDKVHQDSSVSIDDTYTALIDLKDHLEISIEAVLSDIAARE